MEPFFYAWAAKTATVEACEKYLGRYPEGGHASAVLGILEPALFKLAKGENSISRYESYLTRFPKGPHLQDMMSSLDPLVYLEASGKGFFSDFSKHVERFPQGKHAAETRKRMEELKKPTAVAAVSYPQVVDRDSGSGRRAWKTSFSEKGGKIGYRLTGSGRIVHRHGGHWGTWGGTINRGDVTVAAGGTGEDSYWCGGTTHNLCNGRAEFTWVGEDAGGHPVKFEVRVLLRHRNCPGR
jgi:hypothetical protein